MFPDVLVIGAGPAGSIAALVLARAGASVQLIDRASFPRGKLCGDTVNPGTLAIADRLGPGSRIRARGRPITGMLVTGPDGATVIADYPDGVTGAAIERRDLDLVLLESAVAAGADFLPGVHAIAPLIAGHGVHVAGVRVRRASGECDLRARLVIAAEGRSSRVAWTLGLTRFAQTPRRWAFGAYFIDVGGVTSHGEMHIRADGYVGLAPLADGLTNVCLVQDRRHLLVGRGLTPRHPSTLARSALSTVEGETGRGHRRAQALWGPRREGSPYARTSAVDTIMAQAIAADPALCERFADARRVSPISSLGPLAVDAAAAGCPGLLLAGDAAGFIDPMTGDGLRFALRGGELAAEAALFELETGALAHERLRATSRREFARKWRFNRALRSLVSSPRGIGFASALASRWPAPVRLVVGLAGDLHLARR